MRHQAFIPKRMALALLFLFLTITASSEIGAISLLGIFPGENVGDQFAISLCKAGDVNGDSYMDLLIGANLEDTGGDAAGKCYLYLGSAFLDTVPDLTYTGTMNEKFGSDVAGNGDLNGDGYDDISISAPSAGGGGTSSGKVYVFFGGFQPDAEEDLVLPGPTANSRFGECITMEGDLNNDGFDDLVVGAPQMDSTGVVYVYFGGDPMDTIPDLIFRGEHSGDWFGCDVSSGGDLNGDNFDDLLVGAYLNSQAYLWAGKAYLYYGGSLMDTIPGMSIIGGSLGEGFGAVVEIGADINGDAYDDFMISAPYYNDFLKTDAGKVSLFLGGSLLNSLHDGELVGESSNDNFGYALDTGDIDGDGLFDVLVGAPGYGDLANQNGKVYFFTGGFPLDVTADFSDVGGGAFDGLGISVAALRMFHFHPDGSREFVAGGWNVGNVGSAQLYGETVSPTGIKDDENNAVKELSIEVFPNPCSAQLHVKAFLPYESKVELEVFDVIGRKVAVIYDNIMGPGTAEFIWDTRSKISGNIHEGVYFVRFRFNNKQISKKILHLR